MADAIQLGNGRVGMSSELLESGSRYEDQIDVMGEERFFELIRTMPSFIEAHDLAMRARVYCRKRREVLMKKKKTHGHEWERINRQLEMLKHEVKEIRQRDELQAVYQTIKDIYGYEGFSAVKAHMLSNYPETTNREKI